MAKTKSKAPGNGALGANQHLDLQTGLVSGPPDEGWGDTTVPATVPPDEPPWDAELTPNTPAGEPAWDDTAKPATTTDWDAPEQPSFAELAEQQAPAADDWDTVPPPLTLSIETHSGKFNPDIAKILIFGETGTQKTRMASTFPNVIFADADHGMSSVSEQVDKVYIHDDERGFKELQALYDFLVAGGHEYETVVLDTLNEIQRIIMRFTIDEYTHIRRSYGNLPGQSDYGKMLYEFMELTRNFISLPMRVVLLAQTTTQQFETDVLGPQLIGKNTARELARKMDVIGYIYKAAGEQDATVPEIAFDSPQYVTKDRSNRLPTVLQNPTYQRVSAFWK